ncbi:MAG: hypothetical protein PHG53_09655 [Phycisphaerae bacterium]|nr:hypothetical protein [Phycisphaerae bacterium]
MKYITIEMDEKKTKAFEKAHNALNKARKNFEIAREVYSKARKNEANTAYWKAYRAYMAYTKAFEAYQEIIRTTVNFNTKGAKNESKN